MTKFENSIGMYMREVSAYKIQTPGESPRRKHTTYRTRRKFEIKNYHYLLRNNTQ
jgi:hypothetical protein